MNWVLLFFLGFVLSFIGSLPLGLINVTVAETAMRRGNKVALWVALGAALVEYFQAFAVIRFSYLLVEIPLVEQFFHYFALLLFLVLAFYYFFGAKPADFSVYSDFKSGVKPFLKGVAVSSLNFMVFPYWLFYGAFLHEKGLLALDTWSVLDFSLGVMLGAYAVFFLYARMGRWIFLHAKGFVRRTHAIVGWIFLVLGFYQLYSVLCVID